MKISEQLKAARNARAAKVAELNAIQEKAAKEDRGKDAQEQEQFENLTTEIAALDRELKDLSTLERLNIKQAVAVGEEDDEDDSEDDADEPGKSASRVGTRTKSGNQGVSGVRTVHLTKKLDKGIMFARYIKCVGASRGDMGMAHGFAKLHYPDTPQVGQVIKAGLVGGILETLMQKAAVAGGTPTDATWAGPLMEYTQFAGDFIEFLRPQTIIGKFGLNGVPALRAIPFNIHIRGQTSGGAGYWVGGGKPKPLTKFDFNDTYLGFSKVANIAVLTEELLRFSNPSADVLVRDGLAASLIERLDVDFVDPAKAAAANVSPASITHGVTPINSAGVTAADVRADIASAMNVMIGANISPTTAVWIMPATIALRLSLLRNAFGQKEFPDITVNGGLLEGIPVITSQYVPTDTGGALVILANASDIWLADDGQVTVDASREASLQMADAPTNDATTGTGQSLVSMFQTNSVALRAERYINWQKRRANAVVTIDNVAWSGG